MKSQVILNADGLFIKNIIVEKLKDNNNISFLNEEESDLLFSNNNVDTSEYDWSFNWDNVITGLETNNFTAPSNGWFSIDSFTSQSLSLTINNKQNSTLKSGGSFQVLLKEGDNVVASSNFNYSFAPCNGEIQK